MPFGRGVLGVEHLNGLFGYPPTIFVDQHDEFGCVAHPVHGDVQPVGNGLVEYPQAVVGVGQTQPAATRAQPRRGLQHNAFQQRRPADARTESGPDDDVGVIGVQPVDHRHTSSTRC